MREVPRPTPRDIREQFKPVGSRIARVALVPGLIFMVNAAACTPAKGVEPQIQPSPAATAEMSSPTAKSDLATAVPTETKPTVAPTEAPKPTAIPTPEPTPKLSNDQIINQIQSLGASIHSLPKFAPRVTDQQHEQNKNTMDTLFFNPALEALKNSDVATAHDKLLLAKNQKILAFGDILKSVSVPKDIQQKHDPKGKYITKNDSVDPRILEYYLALVDLLVATDSSYFETSK